MTRTPAAIDRDRPTERARPTWWVVADRELRDSWLSGRSLPLLFAYTLLLAVTTQLVAANHRLNYLEQREAVSLTAQVAVALGSLLTLLAAADAVSGERERGSLEALLLTSARRPAIVLGKGVAALSLWVAAYVAALPYLWYLGRDVGVLWSGAGISLLMGTLLGCFLVGFGLTLSCFASSNRLSIAVAFFALLALYVPTVMPSSAQQGTFGSVLLHVDPFTAASTTISRVVIDGHSLASQAGWVVGPVVCAFVAIGAAVLAARRLSLRPGGAS